MQYFHRILCGIQLCGIYCMTLSVNPERPMCEFAFVAFKSMRNCTFHFEWHFGLVTVLAPDMFDAARPGDRQFCIARSGHKTNKHTNTQLSTITHPAPPCSFNVDKYLPWSSAVPMAACQFASSATNLFGPLCCPRFVWHNWGSLCVSKARGGKGAWMGQL